MYPLRLRKQGLSLLDIVYRERENRSGRAPRKMADMDVECDVVLMDVHAIRSVY